MSLLEHILIAIGLAMDASAVSMAAAAAGFASEKRQVFRLAFHFGLFQGIMPFLGWLLGSTVVHYIQRWDHWIAFVAVAAGVLRGDNTFHSGVVRADQGFFQRP